jgi:DNA-binding XRE family transcriptional regulator
MQNKKEKNKKKRGRCTMCKINGKELREMRIKAGMTQKELAKLIDVSEASIGFYENGRTNPTDDTVRKIGILFNVNPKDLELSDEEVGKDIMSGSRKGRSAKNYTPLEVQELLEDARHGDDKVAFTEVEKAKESGWKMGNKRYAVVLVSSLNIPEWQRDTNISRAKEISERYDENKFDPIKVYVFKGKFYIADGAHRALAYLFANKLCILVEILDRVSEEEAVDTFLEQSIGIKKMTQNDRWRAAIKRNLPQYVTLREIAIKNNLQIRVDSEKIENPTAYLSVTRRILSLVDKDKNKFERILHILKELEWCGTDKVTAYSDCVFTALNNLYALYKGREDILEKMLVEKCKGVTYYDAKIATTRSIARIFDELSEQITK